MVLCLWRVLVGVDRSLSLKIIYVREILSQTSGFWGLVLSTTTFLEVNRLNVLDEKDTKTIYRWLKFAIVVTFAPYYVTVLISIYLGLSSLIGPVPLVMVGPFPFLFFTYSFQGIEVNFNFVYPVFSWEKLVMSIITIISLALLALLLWYGEFVSLLRGVKGYERFSDVKRAMESLTRGSKRDKIMVAVIKASLILLVTGMTRIYFAWVRLLPLTTAIPPGILFFAISLPSIYLCDRYFRRRLLPQDRK